MIDSPCIGVCRLENEKCVGCGRTKSEIADWWDMTDNQKQQILDRLLDDYLNESSRNGYWS